MTYSECLNALMGDYNELSLMTNNEDSNLSVIKNSKNNRLLLLKLCNNNMYSAITNDDQSMIVDKFVLPINDDCTPTVKEILNIYSALVELPHDPACIQSVSEYDAELSKIISTSPDPVHSEEDLKSQLLNLQSCINTQLSMNELDIEWEWINILLMRCLDILNSDECTCDNDECIEDEVVNLDESNYSHSILKSLIYAKKLASSNTDKYATHLVQLSEKLDLSNDKKNKYKEMGLYFTDEDEVFKYYGHTRGPIDPDSPLITGDHGDWSDSSTSHLDAGSSASSGGESGGE